MSIPARYFMRLGKQVEKYSTLPPEKRRFVLRRHGFTYLEQNEILREPDGRLRL